MTAASLALSPDSKECGFFSGYIYRGCILTINGGPSTICPFWYAILCYLKPRFSGLLVFFDFSALSNGFSRFSRVRVFATSCVFDTSLRLFELFAISQLFVTSPLVCAQLEIQRWNEDNDEVRPKNQAENRRSSSGFVWVHVLGVCPGCVQHCLVTFGVGGAMVLIHL